MPSHLSSLGFPTASAEAVSQYVRWAVEQGEVVPASRGSYIVWAPGQGVQLWVQVDPEDRIVGLQPHFGGKARMRVALTERVTRPDDSILDGGFYAWADPRGAASDGGAYPFVFDAPDFDLWRAVVLPTVTDIQVAAFAHELRAYPDDEAYYAAQQQKPGFAAEAFIPAGLFAVGAGETTPPRALAIFSGHAVDASLRTNSATGGLFYTARVRTHGGELDVVADPEVVIGGLARGVVVSGSFWLSGRVVETRGR